MWVLECEGDPFDGKKLWLPPGKRWVFGRTKGEDGGFGISDKTVSRIHIILEVESVSNQQCANARSRSKLSLEDKNTKIGTLLNGEQIRGTKVTLQKDDNVFTLGKYKHAFRVTWEPVAFTFSFTSKEAKADPYTELYSRLGHLDVKVLVEYERGQTTHVVSTKRNTAKGLQALIDGNFIVHNDTYVQAIINAATGAEGQLSPLEEDFIANFPDPLQYLPPKSDEPTQRDGSAYAPHPERQDMFEGYTFVFYDRRQYDNLLAPITQGRGKALCRDIEPEKTTIDEFVRYVKGVAGEKGLGEFEDGSEGRGVVVVRFNPTKAPGSDWYANFGRSVALHLDHRLIEQNEFLDAILGNDASVLRKPLEIELSGIIAPPPSAATAVTSQTMRSSQIAPGSMPAEQSEMPPPETSRRGRSRRAGRTQFKGFDDDFSGPISFTNTAPESIVIEEALPSEQPESQSLFVSQNPSQEYSYEPSQPTQPSSRNSRKRHVSPVIIEEDEDLMETMAPAATRLKRQRLERGEPTPLPDVPSVLKKPQRKETPTEHTPLTNVKRSRKIKEPTPDLLEQSRLDREKAAEQAEAERLAVQEKYNGEDITAIRDLAIIEEMPVVRKARKERTARVDDSERWDDKWNGRKNFKKFRRRGAEGGVRGPERILVGLVEAKKRDFGVGDEYWGEDTSTKQRQIKKSKSKNSQMDTQTQDASIVSQAKEKDKAVKGKGKRTQQPVLLLSDDEDSDSGIDFDVGAAAGHSPTSRLTKEKLVNETRASQNTTLQTSPSKKRPAETPLAKEKPSKKAKPTPAPSRQPAKTLPATIVEDSDDDSDDDLKFRFKLK